MHTNLAPMIDTRLLRQKLIDIAMRGLLVEQRPEEGNASDLLEQIRAEKAALIKKGQIKKEKPLPEIKEEEKPFAIPDSWCWVRLGECTHLIGYFDNRVLEKDIHKSGTYPVISQGEKFIDGFSDEIVKVVKQLPLVLFGDHTKNVKYIDFPFIVGAEGVKLHSCIVVFPKYIYFWMLGTAARLRNLGYARHYSLLKKVPIPLPPLAEQKRIVAALEASLKLVDTIAKDSADLDKALNFLRQKVLDMAMRGLLVEQRSEEGNATDLLEQIRAEKAALIKKGQIKKEKPLPEIKEEEEKPFAIPDSWCWVRLGEIFKLINGDRGKNYPAKSSLNTEGIPFISAVNLDGRTVVKDEKLLCVSEEQYNKLGSGKLRCGDIVLCIRGSLGKHGRYPFDIGAIASSLVILRNMSSDEEISTRYLMNYLDASLFYSEIDKYDNGTAQPNLAADSVKKLLVPLPPLAEQKRIVAKLEQIDALIETALN